MPKKMMIEEKALDKALPHAYPHKTKEEIEQIKWGILREHGYKPSREKKK